MAKRRVTTADNQQASEASLHQTLKLNLTEDQDSAKMVDLEANRNPAHQAVTKNLTTPTKVAAANTQMDTVVPLVAKGSKVNNER